MNLSWNHKHYVNAASSPWLIIRNLPLYPSYIFMASLGNRLSMCTVLVCLFLCIFESVHTRIVKYTCIECWDSECMHVCLSWGVVRQLSRCESHNVLQRHTALYCLCCHSDLVFSTINCWYQLIVLASSSFFFTHTHTPNANSFSQSFKHTHMHRHYHTFIACAFFYGRLLLVWPGTNLKP